MKPELAPNVPGASNVERMSSALTMVLKVSMVDLLKKESRAKKANDKKRALKVATKPLGLPH